MGVGRIHGGAPAAVLGRAEGKLVAGLDNLAVDGDASPSRVDAISAECCHLPPAQPRVGHHQDLQLTPPHPRALRRGRRQGGDGGGGGDVRVLVEVAGCELLASRLSRRRAPVNPPQHVLAGQQQALLQPGGHHGRTAPAQVGGHRGGGGLGQDLGEVHSTQAP